MLTDGQTDGQTQTLFHNTGVEKGIKLKWQNYATI